MFVYMFDYGTGYDFAHDIDQNGEITTTCVTCSEQQKRPLDLFVRDLFQHLETGYLNRFVTEHSRTGHIDDVCAS